MSDPRDTLTWAEAVQMMRVQKWITFGEGKNRWIIDRQGKVVRGNGCYSNDLFAEPLLAYSTQPDARFRIATRKVKKMKWQVVRRFDTQEEAEAFFDNLSFTRTGPKFAVESVEVEEEVEL